MIQVEARRWGHNQAEPSGSTTTTTTRSCTAAHHQRSVFNHCFPPGRILNGTYDFSSREDDGKAERRDDDARREEDGQLFAGVAG